MKRKNETLMVSFIGMLVILMILLFSANTIVLKSFRALEKEDSLDHLKRIASAINNELDALNAWAGDYATWDDTYRFMQDGNAEFVASNMTDSSLSQLKIDLIAFVRPNGEIVLAKTVSNKRSQPQPFPPDLLPHLAADSPLIQLLSAGSAKQGILSLATPLMIVARPILTSNGNGPTAGSLIMGRFLNAAEIARLGNLSRVPFTITRVERSMLTAPPFTGKSPLSLAKPYQLVRPSDSIAHGYALLPDIYQQPGALVHATMERHVYMQGIKTVRYFLVWCVLISLLGLVAINWGMGKYAASLPQNERDCLFAVALDQSTLPVAILDAATSRIVQVNGALARLLSHAPEQLQGVLFRELLTESVSVFERCCAAAYQERQRQCCELQLRCHDGSSVPVQMTASLLDQNGQQYLFLLLRPE